MCMYFGEKTIEYTPLRGPPVTHRFQNAQHSRARAPRSARRRPMVKLSVGPGGPRHGNAANALARSPLPYCTGGGGGVYNIYFTILLQYAHGATDRARTQRV